MIRNHNHRLATSALEVLPTLIGRIYTHHINDHFIDIGDAWSVRNRARRTWPTSFILIHRPVSSPLQSTMPQVLITAELAFSSEIMKSIEILCEYLSDGRRDVKCLFVEMAGKKNAIHIANDLHYGIGACGPPPVIPPGMR